METLSIHKDTKQMFYTFVEKLVKRRNSIAFLITGILFMNGLVSSQAIAQEENSFSDNFDINLQLQNMHTWHGFVVTPGFMMGSSIQFTSDDEKFSTGLWGGASSNGSYREFSYYMNYSVTNDFKLSLISHNNYSNSANPNIFSYDKYTSPNFVDVVIDYSFNENIPLSLYWSTILFGNSGDYEIDNAGIVTDSYSNYAELRYELLPNKPTKLSLFVGSAFSFATKKTFYSDSPNIVNTGLTLTNSVEFLDKEVPVSATAFWNPESNIGVLQLAISLF